MRTRIRENNPYDFNIHKNDNSFKYMLTLTCAISIFILIITYNLYIWLISAFLGLIISIFGFRNIAWFIKTKILGALKTKIETFQTSSTTRLKNNQNSELWEGYKNDVNFMNHHNYYSSNKFLSENKSKIIYKFFISLLEAFELIMLPTFILGKFYIYDGAITSTTFYFYFLSPAIIIPIISIMIIYYLQYFSKKNSFFYYRMIGNNFHRDKNIIFFY